MQKVRQFFDSLDDELLWVHEDTIQDLTTIFKDDIDSLIVALSDHDWRIRAGVANALGLINDSSSIPALLTLLWDNEWWVRRCASLSLSKICDKNDVPLFCLLLEIGNADVRECAAAILRLIARAAKRDE